MRDDDSTQVRGLDLIRDVSHDAFEALVRATYLQVFPPGIRLFEAGDRADLLPVLLEGTIELLDRWSGRQTTIMLLEPVRTVALAASIVDSPYLVSARTW